MLPTPDSKIPATWHPLPPSHLARRCVFRVALLASQPPLRPRFCHNLGPHWHCKPPIPFLRFQRLFSQLIWWCFEVFRGVMATMAATSVAAGGLQWQAKGELGVERRAARTGVVFASVPKGLGSSASLHREAVSFGESGYGQWAGVQRRSVAIRASGSGNQSVARPADKPRFIQHKQEAFWFYRFLSIVYDHVINPGHWTEDMREDALEPADLNDPNLVVVDVGGGTGFTTLGVVKTVDAKNVTILDQSPHQLAKAKEKAPLKDCKIIEGDAEDLPFETDYADRYVSAGSIEYWPDPQRGITEAYRVLKKGGKACLIGPVHPTFWLSKFFADVWMLFPTEDEYMEWFTKAGFTDVKIKRIGPSWYRGVRRHGLIMGCSVTGVKPESGESPLKLGPKAEDVKGPWNPFSFVYRFAVGVVASLYYVLVPIYMWLKDQIVPKGKPI